jgi:hypothetical protein
VEWSFKNRRKLKTQLTVAREEGEEVSCVAVAVPRKEERVTQVATCNPREKRGVFVL